MGRTLFILAFGLLILVMLTPFARKAYQRTYFPVIRHPISDISSNILILLTVGVAFSFLYASTGGGVSFLLTRSFVALTPLEAGAFSGAFIFAAARIWALFYSHSFARSLYFTAILVVSMAITVGVFFPGAWTVITDDIIKRGSDDLSLLPKCLFFGVAGASLSEMAAPIMDLFVAQGPSVPFSLVREQLESFENYPRLRGKQNYLKRIEIELTRAVVKLNLGETLSVKWLSGNASPEVRTIIDGTIQAARRKKCDIVVDVLCHSAARNKENLKDFDDVNIKYFDVSGSIRLILIGNSVALLGVQMGRDRQEHTPDYFMVVSDFIRISQLHLIFDKCWELSK